MRDGVCGGVANTLGYNTLGYITPQYTHTHKYTHSNTSINEAKIKTPRTAEGPVKVQDYDYKRT